MNGPASSIPSGNKFGQAMVDQRPRYERPKMFRKKLKPGRPSTKQPQQHWVK